MRLGKRNVATTRFYFRDFAGSKERLLEQWIPATYLALEDVVGVLAAEQKANGSDPVLSVEQYRISVSHVMHARFGMSFRDTAELNQVLAFVHNE